jgi:hypothetical protein
MLTEEYGSTGGKGTFLSGTLSTKNPTWTGLGSNLKIMEKIYRVQYSEEVRFVS